MEVQKKGGFLIQSRQKRQVQPVVDHEMTSVSQLTLSAIVALLLDINMTISDTPLRMMKWRGDVVLAEEVVHHEGDFLLVDVRLDVHPHRVDDRLHGDEDHHEDDL